MCKQTKAETTFRKSDLDQFAAILKCDHHRNNKHVIYSPGVKYLAEKANANWLLDRIASHYGVKLTKEKLAKDERLSSLHFWTLNVAEDNSATLALQADFVIKPTNIQCIPFTDFPIEQIRIMSVFDGKYWTLYLPSEY